MRLFVRGDGNKKIYLKVKAKNRVELAKLLGANVFTINGVRYTLNHVKAEPEPSNAGAGAVIGGLIGMIGGPAGALAGGAIGGIIGGVADNEEKEKVALFNHSQNW
jgi:hypothetical protein